MIRHEDIEVALGDDVDLAFAVKDKDGNAVSMVGATATYRLALKGQRDAVLELSSDDSAGSIVLSGSTATVSFNADDLGCPGNYTGQLRITKSGKAMVSAEGTIKALPLIQ
jgi:hypothetical protein